MNEKLTKREKSICKYMIDNKGQSNKKEIAAYLGVSLFTVNTHLRAIYDKLLINSKTELRKAIK